MAGSFTSGRFRFDVEGSDRESDAARGFHEDLEDDAFDLRLTGTSTPYPTRCNNPRWREPMSLDRDLINTIKVNFADYSSALLHEIVQADNPERWSLEASVAAREVLLDREAGQSQEPLVAKQPEPDPPPYTDPANLAFLFGAMALGAAAGFVVIPGIRVRDDDPSSADQPVPFGPRMAWLALDTTDTEAVGAALGLRGTRAATWAEGVNEAGRASVFVTPPLADWTLVVSTALFPPNRAETFVKPLLERLSRQFDDAQYFCTHGDFELHIWARARKGRLVRGYGWLGQKSLTLWNEGTPTKEERDLGFRFWDGGSITAEPGRKGGVSYPDEDCVAQLAYLWSIDPTTLDQHFKEPVMGLLGSMARDEIQTSPSS